jgi:hypothetical protein
MGNVHAARTGTARAAIQGKYPPRLPRQRADLLLPRTERKGLRPKAPTVDGTSFTAPSPTTTTRLPGLDVMSPFQKHMFLRLLGDKPHRTPLHIRPQHLQHHHQPKSPSHPFVLLSLFQHLFGSIGGP